MAPAVPEQAQVLEVGSIRLTLSSPDTEEAAEVARVISIPEE